MSMPSCDDGYNADTLPPLQKNALVHNTDKESGIFTENKSVFNSVIDVNLCTDITQNISGSSYAYQGDISAEPCESYVTHNSKPNSCNMLVNRWEVSCKELSSNHFQTLSNVAPLNVRASEIVGSCLDGAVRILQTELSQNQYVSRSYNGSTNITSNTNGNNGILLQPTRVPSSSILLTDSNIAKTENFNEKFDNFELSDDGNKVALEYDENVFSEYSMDVITKTFQANKLQYNQPVKTIPTSVFFGNEELSDMETVETFIPSNPGQNRFGLLDGSTEVDKDMFSAFSENEWDSMQSMVPKIDILPVIEEVPEEESIESDVGISFYKVNSDTGSLLLLVCL